MISDAEIEALQRMIDEYNYELQLDSIYNEVMEYLEDWKMRMRLQWHLPIPIDPPKQYVLRA